MEDRDKRPCPECGKPLRISPSTKRWHCDNPECYVDYIRYSWTPGREELKITKIVKVAAL